MAVRQPPPSQPSILTAVHAMLTQAKPYRYLGNLYYLKRDKIVARLARQARELGYELRTGCSSSRESV